MNEINLADKSMFEKHICLGILNSEYQFTTLYAWAETYGFRYEIHNTFLLIWGRQTNGDLQCYFPLGEGDYEECFDYIAKAFAAKDATFNMRPVPMKMLGQAQRYCPIGVEIGSKDSYSDYIYSFEKILQYPGKEYKKKRKAVNAFKRRYSYQYESVCEDNLAECYNALIKILELSEEITQDEYIAYERLFKNFFALNLRGGVIRVDQHIEGIAVGEVCGEQVLIHIRRCNKRFEGIYPAIFQLLLENEFQNSGCTLVNSQDDMGILGLRKSKVSYKPKIVLKKYFIRGADL